MSDSAERFRGGALRKGRVSVEGQIYHVTSHAQQGTSPFSESIIAFAVCPIFERTSRESGARLLTWVLMPDHVHWLIELGNQTSLSYVVSRLKSASAGAYNRASSAPVGAAVWQKGFYDRAIRRDEDVLGAARYIIANPLRAGLVTRLSDYPWWNSVWL